MQPSVNESKVTGKLLLIIITEGEKENGGQVITT